MQRLLRATSAATLSLCLGLAAKDAAACGGLFCSSASPVNQAAERIVFAKNGNGTVTAAIEILYEGPSRRFAWLLPVPAADVTVKVSSKQAFDALQQASNPVYNLQTTFAECSSRDDANSLGSPGAVPSAAAAPDGAAPVQVVASGSVGPYDFVQIEVNPDDEDPAQAAITWLAEEGFDVGALGPEVLRPYLMQDMNLLAFRLSKDTDSGSIRPVMLTYPGERPLIPIRPTAVAANDDMGILVWVLGSARAVPTSYLSLELNEALINWLNPTSNYGEVVSAAADEAGGNGFVTEQAGPARQFAESVFPQWKEDQFAQLRTAQFPTLEAFFLQVQAVATSHAGNLGPAFPGGNAGGNQYDGFADLLSDAELVSLREGATPEQFNSCVSCYFDTNPAVANDSYPPTPFDPQTDPIKDLDVPRFLDAFEELVIAPLRDTRALFEKHKQVTRLYTTMSADEMLVDPEFDLNPDLGEVSNVHTAQREFACNGNDWWITLPQGTALRGNGGAWPLSGGEDLPVNWRILQLSTSGQGDVVLDNSGAVSARLKALGVGGSARDASASDDGGCQVRTRTPSPSGWITWVVSALLIGALGRRRAPARATLLP